MVISDQVWRGWKEITAGTKLSRDTIKMLAFRQKNPFPLIQIAGKYMTTQKKFHEWLEIEFEYLKKGCQ